MAIPSYFNIPRISDLQFLLDSGFTTDRLDVETIPAISVYLQLDLVIIFENFILSFVVVSSLGKQK